VKKLLFFLVLGGMAAMAWRELPAIRRYLRIESM